MGYRKFPTPKAPSGRQGDPCPDPKCSGTLKNWDCGCSFGCDLCWVRAKCDECGKAVK